MVARKFFSSVVVVAMCAAMSLPLALLQATPAGANTPSNDTITYSLASYPVGYYPPAAPLTTSEPDGTVVQLPAAPTAIGMGYQIVFVGWSDGSNTYGPGALYVMGQDGQNVTMTALWYTSASPDEVVSYFEVLGVSGTVCFTNQSSPTSGYCQTPPAPSVSGATFTGWIDPAYPGDPIPANTGLVIGNTPPDGMISEDIAYANFDTGIETVVFNPDFQGTGTPSGSPSTPAVTTTKGTALPLLASVGTMVDPGYTFVGWSYVPGGAVVSSYTPSFNTTLIGGGNSTYGVLYAVWQQTDNFTYSLGTATGTPPVGGSGFDGSTITLASAPSDAGYIFDGWWDGSGGTYAVGVSVLYPAEGTYTLDSAGSDITFTAEWSLADPYSYSLGSPGGHAPPSGVTAPESGSGADGSSITLPNAPSVPGYGFLGWYDDSNGPYTPGDILYPAGSSYTLSSDGNAITFTAEWSTSDSYSYSLGEPGGSAPDNPSATPPGGSGADGSTITLAGAPTATGYGFLGWYDSSRGLYAPGDTLYPADGSYTLASSGSPITFTAEWSLADPYSYNLGSPPGNVDLSVLVTPMGGVGGDGSTVTLASPPSIPGDSFLGWYDGSNYASGDILYPAGGSYTLSSAGADITFTAEWSTTDLYSYSLNGGPDTAPLGGNGADGSSITLAGAPSYPGHLFEGWYPSIDGTRYGAGDQLYAASSSYTLNSQGYSLVFTAIWSSTDTYTYSLGVVTTTMLETLDSASPPNGGSGADGTTITLASAPSFNGFTFDGWAATIGGAPVPTYPTLLGASTTYELDSAGEPITFTALWTVNATDTVDLGLEGLGSNFSQTGLDGAVISLTAPSYTNYNFDGWCSVSVSVNEASSAGSASGQCAGDGGSYFAGPSYLLDSGDPTSSATFDLFAIWTGVPKQISFVDPEHVGFNMTWNYETTHTLPTPGSISNYNFDGWCTNPVSVNAPYSAADAGTTCSNDGGTYYGSGDSYTVTGVATLYAVWTGVPVTVTLSYSNGGSGPTSETYDYNTSDVLPTPTFQYHTFNGWYTASGPGSPIAPTAWPSAPTTWYAQWSSIPATFSYVTTGGSESGGDSTSSSEGTSITLATFTPASSSNCFIGWWDGSGGTFNVSTSTTYPSGGSYELTMSVTTFTAEIAPCDHYSYSYGAETSATSLPSSGVGPNGTGITVGATLAAPAGYTFAGWSDGTTVYQPGASYTLDSGGSAITFTAQWNAVPSGGGGGAPSGGTTPSVTDYTVTFVSDGGSGEVPITGASGTSVALPTPVQAGFTFKGWYTQESGGSLVTSPLTLTSTTTLYAQWSAVANTSASFTKVLTIGDFNEGSAALTAALKAQVRSLARLIKSNGDVAVKLVGYATLPNNTNDQALALARARAVQSYLRSLGVTNITFTIQSQVAGTSAGNRVVVAFTER
ncbi:MAG: InlB B-repeat-containing protein [Acidimicrobiales bacterium]